MRFRPDIYYLEDAAARQIRERLLRDAVLYAAAESPFYRERFRRLGVSVSRFRGLSDLPSLPLTSREDLQERNRDFLAAPAERVVEIVATTGTTGDPVFLSLTEADLERLAENERRGFSWLGISPGDRVHVAVTLDNLFIAGLAYHLGLRKLGASALRIGAQPARRHLDVMRQARPSAVVAVPSLLVALARQARADGNDLASFAPRKAMLIGDSVRGPDLGPNALGRRVEEAWGGELLSTYGLTEAALAFHECPARRGLHAHSDLIVAETVDESGDPLPPGSTGELVLTTLQVEGMPLLRYRTGDVTFLLPSPCPCGRKGARIGPILGRKQHRLKIKGTTVYPKTVEDALLAIEGVENYYLEARTGGDGTDRLAVVVGTRRSDACFADIVSDILSVKARVTPEIRIRSPEEVQKVIDEGGRRKPRIFMDFRGKDRGVP